VRNNLKWGILGTGSAAKFFVNAINSSSTGELIAIASRTKNKAKSFSKENGVCKYYSNYEDLLKDESIDVVYISLPHVLHAEWSIKAANNKKNILCEKPMAMNYNEAVCVINAVKKNKVFFMEGMMYRFHPQTAALIKLLSEKKIGDTRLINATFSYNADPILSPSSYNKKIGAGSIMDVGCYTTSMVRLIAGIANNKSFTNPIDVKGIANIGESSCVDEYSVGILKFHNGVVAQISTGIHIDQENSVRIYGTQGEIYIKSPWVPGGRAPGEVEILYRNTRYGDYKKVVVKSDKNLYSLEVDGVFMDIDNKQSSKVTWEDSLGNMKTLDKWRSEVGIQY
jgi:predicted dehydrogenase